MSSTEYENKVVYYGGYPGSTGEPIVGRLVWRNDVLTFIPRESSQLTLRFLRDQLLGVRHVEEGMTGARRVRLLISVEAEQGDEATLKFEMRAVWRKEHDLQRWLDVLGPACRKQEGGDV